MESAIFGLMGVLLGSLITVAREWWFQSRKDRKESKFLAILVVGKLDRFIAGCANVVSDDGLCDGSSNSIGLREAQVTTPKFELESLKVEWQSLPDNLAYEVLDLPYKAEIANQRISGAFEYFATAPDFNEGFEERQFQYAALGLEAANLAVLLRKHAKLPIRRYGDWDPVNVMCEQKAKSEQFRSKTNI